METVCKKQVCSRAFKNLLIKAYAKVTYISLFGFCRPCSNFNLLLKDNKNHILNGKQTHDEYDKQVYFLCKKVKRVTIVLYHIQLHALISQATLDVPGKS